MQNDKTPFERGYRMPAEWDPHEGTWLAWPKDPDSFPDEILKDVEKSYIGIINALHKHEKVHILVDDEYYDQKVTLLLKTNGIEGIKVSIHKIQTADVWFRDYGPIFITKKTADGKKELAFTHWKFNAWGNKYEGLVEDSKIPKKLPLSKILSFNPGIVLEGGSIDMNGLGTCLTTEQCLLNKNRNPHLDKKQIETYLKDYLGATNVIWLKEGIVGDDTDGHVDDIARFVNKNTVVCAQEEEKKDKNYAALKADFDVLEHSKDQDGNGINVIPLPMPKAVIYKDRRLPASYANFYIANKIVLVPVFDDPNDKKAIEILQKLFPDRKVIGIDCRALVYGFGSIHCVTQQQPSI